MTLTILSVAYPLAPVGPDAVGGAEQVLTQLDRALVAAGHRSIVVARGDSQTAGILVPVPAQPGVLDEGARQRAWRAHREAIATALRRWPVDLVHLHGIDCAAYLPPPGVPALVTLHLPPAWYPAELLGPTRPGTWLHCVSAAQHAACPKSPNLLPPIENGVSVKALAARHAKRALRARASAASVRRRVSTSRSRLRSEPTRPLLIAGDVFPYEAHRRYFTDAVQPRLDARRRFVGPAGFARKRRLLTAARCLLVPSLAPETSSLVAREALACGTPVIGFPHGALPDTIEHGRTGFLVDSVDGMADAIGLARGLDAALCRRVAAERFSLGGMTARYFALYRRLARPRCATVLAGAA